MSRSSIYSVASTISSMFSSTSASPMSRTLLGVMVVLMLCPAEPGTPDSSIASETSLVVSTGTLAWIRLALVRILLLSTGLSSLSYSCTLSVWMTERVASLMSTVSLA